MTKFYYFVILSISIYSPRVFDAYHGRGFESTDASGNFLYILLYNLFQEPQLIELRLSHYPVTIGS